MESTDWAELVDWFENTKDLPERFFPISSYEHILAPVKYYECLKRNIAAGTDGPRGKHGGAVIHDLITLKKILH